MCGPVACLGLITHDVARATELTHVFPARMPSTVYWHSRPDHGNETTLCVHLWYLAAIALSVHMHLWSLSHVVSLSKSVACMSPVAYVTLSSRLASCVHL